MCLSHWYAVSRAFGCTLIPLQIHQPSWPHICHSVMVEAEIHLVLLPKSIVDVYNFLSHFYGYGASLGDPLCNTSKMYIHWVRLTSHESETAQKAQTTWQTTSPWCWSRSPLQWRVFDEPMPPEGWAALRMIVPMPPSKRFNRFIKLM